jgi:Domain of unknown function (DUF4314)
VIMVARETVEAMRRDLIGKRVRLVRTTDPYTNLKSGDEGVVDHVDDIGTVFVKWDNGSGLGLVQGEDSYWVVS